MRQVSQREEFARFSDGVTQSLYLSGKKKKGRRAEVVNRVRHCVTASQARRFHPMKTAGGVVSGLAWLVVVIE